MNGIDKQGVVPDQIHDNQRGNAGILHCAFAGFLELRSQSMERMAAVYLQPLSDQPRCGSQIGSLRDSGMGVSSPPSASLTGS